MSNTKIPIKLSYYLKTSDFLKNVVTIPTNNMLKHSKNTSLYFSGRSKLYNNNNNKHVGDCAATFLCINTNNVYVQIQNYISTIDGLIISWFTPSTVKNLIIDDVIFGMVTECIVEVTTKIGVSPYYGLKFNMIVSSNNGKIYFNLTQIVS